MGALKATLDKLSNKTSIIGNELTSLDERLCETNNILTDISIKLDRNPKEINPEQQPNLETKRLEILRKQNEEMREVLNECYTKACEILSLNDKEKIHMWNPYSVSYTHLRAHET